MHDFTKEIIAVEADSTLPALRVVRVLGKLLLTKGKLDMIWVDHGSEFISKIYNGKCRYQINAPLGLK